VVSAAECSPFIFTLGGTGELYNLHFPLLLNIAERISQQDLKISHTDKDKESEGMEKARGLITF